MDTWYTVHYPREKRKNANDVTGDIVIEQTKQSYDAVGNVWLARHFRRFDGLSGTGELNDPAGADPNALVTYTVSWFDDLGRTTTTAFYGTNGNTVITSLPSEPAPDSSDDCIVTQYEYDANTGRLAWTKDNKDRKTVREYDDLSRTTKLIENYSDGNPTNETADKDRTTEYTYDPNSRLAVVTAKAQNADYDQKTYYCFWNTDNGTTKSNLSSGSMVTAVVYPDSDEQAHVALTDGLWVLTPDHDDYVANTYDRLGRKLTATDQRQVVHKYTYDTTTGRLLSDDANTVANPLPSSVDSAVTKIGYTYDDFGRTTKVTSYDGDGDPNNQVAFEYGAWGAVTKSMQDHEDEAGSTDPNVQYAYEDGIASNEAKYVRPDYVTYPGPSTRRAVYYNYPTSGVGAALSRLGEIADNHGDQGGRTRYASYTYLGAGTMVDANYPAVTGIPALTYGSRANSYSGLDRFGRVVDQKWQNQSGTPVAKDRFKYAYDRASNRVSRDPAADSHTPPDANDNYYTYDGLDRLVKSNWGTLDGSGVITDQNADANQAWGLDPVGNWTGFKSSGATTQPWDLEQTRLHNKANEIEDSGETPNAISGTPNWVDPTYDAAGNMISGPQPRFETADANSQWYKYDAWNRLTRVGQGSSSPGTLVVTYSYDGQNRRIRKVVEAGENDITYDYYYNESWQVLEVRKGADPDAYQQYVWGLQYIDAPVVSFLDGNLDGDVSDAGTDSTLYYTYDGNFNVTAVVKPDGTVAERYTYDPYGQVTFKAANWSDAANQAKSAYDNEILYCGYRFDPESGNYIARNRYLTPPLGRWISRDPAGYDDGANLYGYVRSNPIRRLDSFGLSSEEQNCYCGPAITDAIIGHLNDFISQPQGDLNPWYLIGGFTLSDAARTNGHGGNLGRAADRIDGVYECGRGPCRGTVTICDMCISQFHIDHILIMVYIATSYGPEAARSAGQYQEHVLLGFGIEGGSFQGSSDAQSNADLHFNELGICISQKMKHADANGGTTDKLTRQEVCDCVSKIDKEERKIISQKPSKHADNKNYHDCRPCKKELLKAVGVIPPIDL